MAPSPGGVEMAAIVSDTVMTLPIVWQRLWLPNSADRSPICLFPDASASKRLSSVALNANFRFALLIAHHFFECRD
jgi:hypothetical protein